MNIWNLEAGTFASCDVCLRFRLRGQEEHQGITTGAVALPCSATISLPLFWNFPGALPMPGRSELIRSNNNHRFILLLGSCPCVATGNTNYFPQVSKWFLWNACTIQLHIVQINWYQHETIFRSTILYFTFMCSLLPLPLFRSPLSRIHHSFKWYSIQFK
jgi:hypothetical protein